LDAAHEECRTFTGFGAFRRHEDGEQERLAFEVLRDVPQNLERWFASEAEDERAAAFGHRGGLHEQATGGGAANVRRGKAANDEGARCAAPDSALRIDGEHGSIAWATGADDSDAIESGERVEASVVSAARLREHERGASWGAALEGRREIAHRVGHVFTTSDECQGLTLTERKADSGARSVDLTFVSEDSRPRRHQDRDPETLGREAFRDRFSLGCELSAQEREGKARPGWAAQSFAEAANEAIRAIDGE
jgi:hypothetical protein